MLKNIPVLLFATLACLSLSCSDDAPSRGGSGGSGNNWTGGQTGSGGSNSAGGSSASGGGTPATGGSSPVTGGAPSQGGTGGSAAGGEASTGGTASGGAPPTGGVPGAGGMSSGGTGTGGSQLTMEWLPSWATSNQRTEDSNLPPMSLPGNTVRQKVWPTVSGEEIRIKLSNLRGTSELEIQKVHIAMADGVTGGNIVAESDTAFTFNGGDSNVTIAAGETVWSDPVAFSLEALQLTTISMLLGQNTPVEVTGHPGARTTTYMAAGDAVSDASIAGGSTKPRWYFIEALEVMAPSDHYAIAILGDSITDGYDVLDEFKRWPDYLTLRIKDDPEIATTRSVLNFGMGANNLTVTGTHQDSGVQRFRRDVLGHPKIKWLFVLEGINDLLFSEVNADSLIEAYDTIIEEAHAEGILVYGSPILPSSQLDATQEQYRMTANEHIINMANFDEVVRLDQAVDPMGNGSLAGQFDNDGLHPNKNAGYSAMADAVPLSLFYDSTLP